VAAKIEISNLDNLLERYRLGESENKLASEAGINRWTFRQRLIKAGITPRGQSESERAKWASMTPDQRAAQTSASHDAARGRKIGIDELGRNALGRETSKKGSIFIEYWLAMRFADLGYSTIQQKAVGKYNIDVAINCPPVAVEIFGGSWHSTGKHAAKFHERTKYLFDAGWSVVIVWVDGRRYPIDIGAVNRINILAQDIRRDPSARRQYLVILGNGDNAPVIKSKLNASADIERLGCSVDPTGRIYYISG